MDRTHSEVITIDTKDGNFSGFFAQQDSSAPRLLVYHAWWGLNPFFKEFSSRLAQAGFTVFAPDLYDGKIATTVQEAETMLKQRDQERHTFVAASAVAWMQEQPSSYSGLGLLGFSMGGAWVIELAGLYPEAVKAGVLFYGVGEADYSKVRTRFQGHFGGQDEWEPLSGVQYMEKEMDAKGVQHQFFTYPEAQHWFFETNRPEYREQDAALAWERTVKFLKEAFTQ